MINIKKSQPAPECLSKEKLKLSGDYKCGDVLQRLKDDFHNKCYICEEKEPTTINVEHFIPHKGDIELKFDWNNLFFSCGHCNNTKLAKYDNILNCTEDTPIIVNVLKFNIDPFPIEKIKITALNKDTKTVITANLLNEVYNGNTPIKNIESSNLRNKVLSEISLFKYIIDEYYKQGTVSSKIKEKKKDEVIRNLQADSPFTAFKIWIIKNNPKLFADFKDFI